MEHGGEKSTISVTVAAAEHRSISRSAGRGELHESRDDGERLAALRAGSHRVEPVRRHPAARRTHGSSCRTSTCSRKPDSGRIAAARETAAQFSAQRIFSANLVGDVRGMVRDVSAQLWSNAASTPIVASQDRGFRELYVKGAVSAHAGVHELKAGADVSVGHVREDFAYRITDPRAFDDATPASFQFCRIATPIASRRSSSRIRCAWARGRSMPDCDGIATRLSSTTTRSARGSPRPGRGRRPIWCCAASYDRAFQTPAIENLLLASSESVERLGERCRAPAGAAVTRRLLRSRALEGDRGPHPARRWRSSSGA